MISRHSFTLKPTIGLVKKIARRRTKGLDAKAFHTKALMRLSLICGLRRRLIEIATDLDDRAAHHSAGLKPFMQISNVGKVHRF